MHPGTEVPSSPLFTLDELRDVVKLTSVRASDEANLIQDAVCEAAPVGSKCDALEDLDAAIAELEADETIAHHEQCWRRYLARHSTPTHWRGRRDVVHYERLIWDLIELQRVRRRGRTMVRIRVSEWRRVRAEAPAGEMRRAALKRHRRESRAILVWLHSLPPRVRAELSDSYRVEERERAREERYIARLNADVAAGFSRQMRESLSEK